MRGSEWSPQLHEAVCIHHYWTIMQGSASSGKELHPESLAKLEESVSNFDKHQGNPHRKIWKQKRISLKNLKQAIKMDQQNRRKFLDDLIESRSAAEGVSIKTIKHAEHITRLHRRFNLLLKTPRKQVQKLRRKVGDHQTLYTTKHEIEQALHSHIENHFAQPKMRESPFATVPIYDHFGHGATTKQAKDFVVNPDHILPPTIHPLAAEVMKELRPHHNEPAPADFEITTANLIEEYSKWKERTSTSPYGTHLCHYRV